MTPQFALSLSQNGIELLRLQGADWQSVAQADPSAPDLAAQMHALRVKADRSDAEPLPVTIILPTDQVKFFSLETSGLNEDERTSLVETTLDETTPYSADEIVFDAQVDGQTTHVAAVAEETLAEAETFARQFGFAPAAYVAQPEGGPAFAIEPRRNAFKTPGETAETVSALKNAAKAPSELVSPDAVETPGDDPTFVSRRRVPTFRTRDAASAPEPGLEVSAGFAEAETPFEGAPSGTAPEKISKTRAKASGTLPARTEKDRMRVFGTETHNGLRRGVGPLGIGIAAASVVALGLVAFAHTALGTNLSSFIALLNAPKPTAQFTAPLQPQITGETAPSEQNEVELASLNDALTDEDQAVLDALRAPVLDAPTPRADRTTNEMRAAYAVTGIWPLAPEVPTPPPLVDLDNLYQTSVDPIEKNFDAVALPALTSYRADVPFLALASPAPAGTVFELDDSGFVIPTAQGALNPDGVRVFAGLPPVQPPSTLVKLEDPGQDMEERLRLAGFRPQARPADLIETNERASLGGLTRVELGEFRPKLRPASAQETAVASASLVPLDSGSAQPLVSNDKDLLATATARAVPVSLRPDARPLNFAAVVEQAQRTPAAPAVQQVAAASPAPRLVAPSIPSTTSVTREATIKNAVNLRKVNLIGVYGKPSSRRALVRLSNGRYQKVEVGDRIDGGRVSAIGDAELRYQKSGRDIVLKMPRS